MFNTILRFIRNDEGATAIEYGLIAALIAVGIVLAATTLGTDLAGIFGDISAELNPA